MKRLILSLLVLFPFLAFAQPAGKPLNPCMSERGNLKSVTATTSGTSSVQLVALVSDATIYVCSLTVVAVSGTSPTFALRSGTGSACATGTVTLVSAFGQGAANTVQAFAWPVAVASLGHALCYIQTGTAPVSSVTITYVQQ